MTIQLQPDVNVELTTEHATSSYGVPVMLYNGQAYGPGDQINLPAVCPDIMLEPSPLEGSEQWTTAAGVLVEALNFTRSLSADEISTVAAFLGRKESYVLDQLSKAFRDNPGLI